MSQPAAPANLNITFLHSLDPEQTFDEVAVKPAVGLPSGRTRGANDE